MKEDSLRSLGSTPFRNPPMTIVMATTATMAFWGTSTTEMKYESPDVYHTVSRATAPAEF